MCSVGHTSRRYFFCAMLQPKRLKMRLINEKIAEIMLTMFFVLIL